MQVGKPKVLDEGNLYSKRPVVELRLLAGAELHLPVGTGPAVSELLPVFRSDVIDFAAWRRLILTEGSVPMSAVIEVLAILVQRYIGWPVSYSSWEPAGGAVRRWGRSRAVYEIGSRKPGLRAGKLAVELAAALLRTPSRAEMHALFTAGMDQFLRKTRRETPGIDSLAIAGAAAERGIPWAVVPGTQYLRLGQSRFARYTFYSETSLLPALSKRFAKHKSVTSGVLRSAGLPVAKQRCVRRAQQALEAAHEIGFPLVVKPAEGNLGKEVTVGIQDDDALIRAFERARTVSAETIIEAMIPGHEHRLLAIGGQFVAAACRRPAHVRGDGASTVRDLIQRENERAERSPILPSHRTPLIPIILDQDALEVLSHQGLSPESVPPAGATVRLRKVSNVSRGGDTVDLTEQVHPSIRDMVSKVASVLSIDVCGIDFITTDITKPYWETGGAICEVNTRPGLTLHRFVSEGTPRNVADDIVRMLFPDGCQGRAPAIALVNAGSDGRRLRRVIEEAAQRVGKRLGVVTSEEVAEADARQKPSAAQRFNDVESLSLNDQIECAILETSAAQLIRRGLGFQKIDLAVIPRNGDEALTEAVDLLGRLSGGRIAYADDSSTLEKALRALGLAASPRSQTAASSPPTPQAAASRPRDFTVLLTGDIGFGEQYFDHPRTASLRRGFLAQGYSYSLASLRPLLDGADLIVGNLEVPLSSRLNSKLKGRKKFLGWSEPDQTVAALQDARIGAVSLANNHMLDCGVPGLLETLDRLRDAGIVGFGAGIDPAEADRPFIRPFVAGTQERTLIVFGAFEHRPRYESRYGWYARSGSPGVGQLSTDRIAASIAALRDRLPSPFFVVYPHWGVDYSDVTSVQRLQAERLIRAGVDMVIGHGSHTAQEVMLISERPVVFGLGNFVWNAPGRYTKFGAKPYSIVSELRFQSATGGCRLRLFPILTDNRVTDFQSRPVTMQEFPEAAALLAGARSASWSAGVTDDGLRFLELKSSGREEGVATQLLHLPNAPHDRNKVPHPGRNGTPIPPFLIDS